MLDNDDLKSLDAPARHSAVSIIKKVPKNYQIVYSNNTCRLPLSHFHWEKSIHS